MSIGISDCWYKDVCTAECSDTCIRFKEMYSLMSSSFIPQSKWTPVKLQPSECDYDAFCTLNKIKNNITDFVDRGDNLYICSKSTGNGKTSWSIKLLTKYFDSIWAGNGFRTRGFFIHTPTFLIQCKNFQRPDAAFDAMREQLPYVDLVVWDDIASTELSSYDYSQLLMYIDVRTSCHKSNIFTGNLTTRPTLQKALGDKLTSRVWNDRTTIVQFNGGDRR